MTKNTLSRRSFVKFGVASLATATMPKLILATVEENVFQLTAVKTNHSFLNDGNISELWTFNDMVSGPEIRAVKGRQITIIFKNELDEATSIHWHGIRIDNKMDGVSGLTQEAVKPGEEFTYSFTVPDAGTFWYHAHNMSWSHVARGLYGALIVEETEPLFDREHDITVIIDDWRLDAQGKLEVLTIGGIKEWALTGRIGNFVTVNGKFQPQFQLKLNHNYRIRMINAANSRIMAFDINQMGAITVGLDGQALSAPVDNDQSTFFLGPAQRVDLFLSPKNTDSFSLIDIGDAEPIEIANFHIENSSALALNMPKLIPNELPPLDLKNAFQKNVIIQGGAMSSMETPIYNGRKLSIVESLESKQMWAFNGIANLTDSPFFELKKGQTIILDFLNDTSFRHAIHIHGHHFKVINNDYQENIGQPWRDTYLTKPNGTVKIAFTADNPGKWLLHCHMLEHSAGGMKTWFNVI
ncbi:MAG: multicopper oxidase family protein [OCS116 cluster bacterium]|nr:multicopper oxidase family protein [OCS116 cluster bacterium]